MTTVQDPSITDESNADIDTELSKLFDLIGGRTTPNDVDDPTDDDFINALLADCAEAINQSPLGQNVVAKPERGEGRHHKINLHHPETDEILGSFGMHV